MPAKPLTPEQKRDAERLGVFFRAWQSARREAGEPWTQEVAAEAIGMTQGALSQYLRGAIPLNFHALVAFAHLIGTRPDNISPTLAQELRTLAMALDHPLVQSKRNAQAA